MAWLTKVLAVANVTADSDELLDALRARSEAGAVRVTLLVPCTGGARRSAESQLERALERLRQAGIEAEGEIGAPDPVAAVGEIWSPGRFDEIVVSSLPEGASRWLESGLPRRLERLTDARVTHVVARTAQPRPPHPPRPREQTHLGLLTPLGALGWGKREDRR
jgi:hypothetical protein